MMGPKCGTKLLQYPRITSFSNLAFRVLNVNGLSSWLVRCRLTLETTSRMRQCLAGGDPWVTTTKPPSHHVARHRQTRLRSNEACHSHPAYMSNSPRKHTPYIQSKHQKCSRSKIAVIFNHLMKNKRQRLHASYRYVLVPMVLASTRAQQLIVSTKNQPCKKAKPAAQTCVS